MFNRRPRGNAGLNNALLGHSQMFLLRNESSKAGGLVRFFSGNAVIQLEKVGPVWISVSSSILVPSVEVLTL